MTLSDTAAPESEPDTAERNVETRTWHAVLQLHGAVTARLNRTISREFGLTLAKFDVMAQLLRHPEGLTQGSLSQRLKVTGGNVTGLVRRMTGEGLITRHMSPDDRRVFVVQLTGRGRETYLAARNRHDTLLEDWFGEIEPDAKEQVRGTLLAMAAHVETGPQKAP